MTMTQETEEKETLLNPIKLDSEQMEELDRLINSLKKEVVHPEKKDAKKVDALKVAHE